VLDDQTASSARVLGARMGRPTPLSQAIPNIGIKLWLQRYPDLECSPITSICKAVFHAPTVQTPSAVVCGAKQRVKHRSGQP
jgi:hypothetical protein